MPRRENEIGFLTSTLAKFGKNTTAEDLGTAGDDRSAIAVFAYNDDVYVSDRKGDVAGE